MLFTAHFMAGAAIGAAAGNPYVGFFAGFLSHHIMDSLPHFDQGSRRIIKDRAPYLGLKNHGNGMLENFNLYDWLMLFADWAVSLIIFCAIFFLSSNQQAWLSILSGVFGGLLPDIIGSSPLWSKKLKSKSVLAKKYGDFHNFFHWTVSEKHWIPGIITQIAIIAAAFLYLVRS